MPSDDVFENTMIGQVLGNLVTSLLLLLAYFMYLLWQDYIATILCAFLLSQALRAVSGRLLDTLDCLRDPASPPLLTSMMQLLLGRHASQRNREPASRRVPLLHMPPLLLLAVLLLVLLLADRTRWGWVSAGALATLAALALPLWLFDKRLLRWKWLISDESLIAAITLGGLLMLLAFVGFMLLVNSLGDLAA